MLCSVLRFYMGMEGALKKREGRRLPQGTQQAHGKVGFESMAPDFYFSALPLAQNFPFIHITEFLAWE